jgi:hypothetical protein
MCNLAQFKLRELEIEITSVETPTLILLRLREDMGHGKGFVKSTYPISGFPRLLVREDEETGKLAFFALCHTP